MATLPSCSAGPAGLSSPLVQGRRPAWLQVVSHISPEYGGIATSVPRLARATEAQGMQACPIAGFCETTELAQVQADLAGGVTIFPAARLRWIVDRKSYKHVETLVNTMAGVHIHGVWETHCMVAADVARICRRPYLISAHGMLEQWALRHKRLKKALYAALFEIRRMQRAACLRALSLAEVDDYRRIGLTTPIAIVPNGVDEQPISTPSLFRLKHPELDGKQIVLFLGRLHQKKGVHLLLRAWAHVSRLADDIHLVIAGPDSENTLSSLESSTNELGIRSSVTFVGMLKGELKSSALAAASLFVLPSYSEGFSMAVIEAMAAGIPVLVTTQCHIPEVQLYDCGWIIAPDVRALQNALTDFLTLSEAELRRTGQRGKELVNARFHNSVVGKQMAQVYEWLQSGKKPTAVEIV